MARGPDSQRNEVRQLVVAADDDGRRLDNFLATALGNPPRSMVYRIIRTGEVRVNGGRAQPARKLQPGDVVRVPPVWQVAERRDAPPAAQVEAIRHAIVYEDARVLVLDKPAGLAAHGGTGIAYGAVDLVRALRPDAARIDLVHRLDRDTSGCLLFAKDTQTLRRLNANLARNDFTKEYLALLGGQLLRRKVVVDAALDSVRDAAASRRTVESDEGRAAQTTFCIERRFADCCLVRAQPTTGRTHQIRAHARAIGHPLAGDPKYGDPALNRALRRLGLRRMFLHAAALEFELERRVLVECPLPAELQQVLARLMGQST